MIGVELGVEAWAAALIIMGIMRRLALALAVACCCPHPALADAKAGEAKAQLCILCHREAPDKRFAPTLEGQPVDYLVAAIMAFKAGRRVDPAMNANVANLSQADVRDIAEFFASRPVPARGQELEPDKVKAGERLAAEMKCGACHGAGYHGSGATARLAGQKPSYLVWQMEAMRGGRRSHPTGLSALKSAEDLENVASYLASLP